MAKKMVKCKYCGIQFDRNAEPFVAVGGRRYAHKACAEKHDEGLSQEERNYAELEAYIKELFQESYLNAKVKAQIKNFKKEYNYTYSGMLKTLKWWYQIKGNSVDLARGGVGIIPYVYNEALNYYYTLFLAQNANKDLTEFRPKVQEIEISSPRVRVKKQKLFNLGEEE